MAEKRYLFTPGPTPVPPEVLEATSRPILHHRSSDFRAILARCFERLRQVYRTEADVLVYTASGTGGMESAVSNLTRPGDLVITLWSLQDHYHVGQPAVGHDAAKGGRSQ